MNVWQCETNDGERDEDECYVQGEVNFLWECWLGWVKLDYRYDEKETIHDGNILANQGNGEVNLLQRSP